MFPVRFLSQRIAHVNQPIQRFEFIGGYGKRTVNVGVLLPLTGLGTIYVLVAISEIYASGSYAEVEDVMPFQIIRRISVVEIFSRLCSLSRLGIHGPSRTVTVDSQLHGSGMQWDMMDLRVDTFVNVISSIFPWKGPEHGTK